MALNSFVASPELLSPFAPAPHQLLDSKPSLPFLAQDGQRPEIGHQPQLRKLPALVVGSQNEESDLDDEISENESEGDDESGDENQLTGSMLSLPAGLYLRGIGNSRQTPKRQAPTAKASHKRSRPNGPFIKDRVTPWKQPSDPNNYRVITLSNGLTAVLIQKPELGSSLTQSKTPSQLVDLLWDSTCRQPFNRCRGQNFQLHNQALFEFPVVLPALFARNSGPFSEWLRIEGEKMSQGLDEWIANNNKRSCSGPLFLDEETRQTRQKANLAVVVNVGLADDPDNCLGLAHFTEHMLHYGSKKYPHEAAYLKFTCLYGFGFNAFTENHTTTYYNIVRESCVEKSADMMANMLSEPAFNNSMTTREVNAVDSEFHLKRHLDILRRLFLFQTALRGHPMEKFGFGNAETLLEPKSIHKTLESFHAKYYKAGAITVGLESHKTLCEQEAIVLKQFGNIKRGNRGIYRETPPTAQEKKVVGAGFNKDFIMQGQCSFSTLWVAWPVPVKYMSDMSNKTLDVVYSLIGQKDEHTLSLSRQLETEGYIWYMMVQNPVDGGLMKNKYTGFMNIEFYLTPDGESHVPEIMRELYSFLDRVNNLPDSKMNEQFELLKKREQRWNKYGSKSEPKADAISCATALQREPKQNILNTEGATWEVATFKPQEVRTVLKCLKTSKMIVIQTLPRSVKLGEYVKGVVCKAPYTNAEYVSQKINQRFESSAQKSCATSSVAENTSSNPNPMLALELKPPHYGIIKQQSLPMPNISSFKVLAAIHVGNKQNQYDAACLINLLTPLVSSTARNMALSLLWTTSVMFSMLPEYQQANFSGVWFAAIPSLIGIHVLSWGFPEKLLDFQGALMDQLYSKDITSQAFKSAQKMIRAVCDLLLVNNADFVTGDVIHFMSCKHSKDVLSDAFSLTQSLTVENLITFRNAFRREAMALVLVQGNLPLTCGSTIGDIINRQNYFPFMALFSWFRLNPCVSPETPMHPGERCVRLKSDLSYCHTTTVTNFYYVGLKDDSDYKLWRTSLLFFPMKTFEHLRMRKQLGYAIYSDYSRGEDDDNDPCMTIAVCITATATKFTQCELDKHIDNFMVEYGNFLNEVSDAEFCTFLASIGQESSVKMSDARKRYQRFFGDNFAKQTPQIKYGLAGICKRSIQVVGNEAKPCNCERCTNIDGWAQSEFCMSDFKFAKGKNELASYFIDDPRKIRDGND